MEDSLMAECKVLIGRRAICEFLGIKLRLFYALIDEGAPITKGAGGWRSHKELLEQYFKQTIQGEKKS
jgi:hypothetical protein